MPKLAEILQKERERATIEQCSVIHLFQEGTFYRAYEWSAWLCHRYVKEFKPTHRLLKDSDDSDWDLLLLLDKQKNEFDDFDKYAYPIMECGFDLSQYFSVHTYTKKEWYDGRHAMFFYNVEHDKQLLYESL